MAPRQRWNPAGQSLIKLFEFLDRDPERAAEQCEKIRDELIRLFEWIGYLSGDHCRRLDDRPRSEKTGRRAEAQPEHPCLYLRRSAELDSGTMEARLQEAQALESVLCVGPAQGERRQFEKTEQDHMDRTITLLPAESWRLFRLPRMESGPALL